MRAWAYVAVAGGLFSSVASCSAGQGQGEQASTISQAATGNGVATPPFPQIVSTRSCQLIGDLDFAKKPQIINTKGQSFTNFGVRGTDNGYPIVDTRNGKVFFYFGDTNPDGHGYDVVASAPAQLPSDGCPTLDFGGFYSTNAGDLLAPPILTIDLAPRSVLQAPQGGFYDDDHDRLYVFYGVADNGDLQLPPSSPSGRSVLTFADPATPNQLHSVNTAPFNAPTGLSKFYINAPILVRGYQVPTIPLPNLNPQDRVVLVYGASSPYRQGTIQLAAVRLDDIADASKYQYKATDGWSSNPDAAAPIFDPESPPCVGEMGASFNETFGLYMITYTCTAQPQLLPIGPNSGVFLRTATNPLGPWSTPVVIFDPIRDQATGIYIHDANPRLIEENSGQFVRTPGDLCSAFGNSCEPPTINFSCIKGLQSPPHPWCLPPVSEDNSPNGSPGCCSSVGNCCDLAFTDTESEGNNTAWGSANSGGFYAPYVVQPYSQATAFVPGTQFATQQDLYYVMSTWNPYVVDLMKSTIINNDRDGDGIPDVNPDGTTGDNCPLIYNPGQENCNAEAEESWNANHPTEQQIQVLGDACDPVPCPNADANTPSGVNIPCTRRNPSLNQVCEYREIHDDIAVNAVGSGVNDSTTVTLAPTSLHEAANVQTHARFCQNIPGPAPEFPIVYCGGPGVETDDQLIAVANADAETFDPRHPWHRVTVSEGSLVSQRTDSILLSYDYGGNPGQMMHWSYDDDNTYWHRNGMNVVGDTSAGNSNCANDASFGAGTCLLGRFWLNGTSPVGITSPTASDGTHVGLHGGATIEDYYFDIAPDQATFEVIPGVGVLPRSKFVFRTPGDPGPEGRPTPNWQIYERGVAVPIFVQGTDVLGLRQSSALVDASASFGASFARELRSSLAWTNAPGPSAANLNAPMALALSDDGTEIAATANLVGGQVLLGRDVELVADTTRGSSDFEELGALADVRVPASLRVLSGNAGNGLASLEFDAPKNGSNEAALQHHGGHGPDTVHCTYRGGAASQHPTDASARALGDGYVFVSCSNGANANDLIRTRRARLTIESCDLQAGATVVESALTALEVDGSPFPINQGHSEKASTGPRPRRDYVSTYAPSLNGVFVIGGRSRWNEGLSDLWFKPFDGPWQQVKIPTGVLGRVTSAAFSPADGRLWVIDEVDSSARNIGSWCGRGRAQTRLLRIERQTGDIRVIASEERRGLYEERSLLVDRDGQILLFANSQSHDVHSLVRLVADSNEFDAFAAINLPGAIVDSVSVDARGYSFVQRPSQGSPHAFALNRVATLPFQPAPADTWTKLLE